MKIRFWQKVALATALLTFCGGAAAWAGEPFDLVQAAVERTLAILRDPMLNTADKKKERFERLKAVTNPLFDFDEMARRTLAAHWRRRAPAEQQEFAKLFRGFLERLYSDRVDLYDGERVVLGRETVDQEYAEVEANIIGAKGEETSVNFRLIRADGQWKVYDAVVEHVSLVNNYRSQFDRVISKSSYEALKKLLAEKAR